MNKKTGSFQICKKNKKKYDLQTGSKEEDLELLAEMP
jgi:hypothetical protein